MKSFNFRLVVAVASVAIATSLGYECASADASGDISLRCTYSTVLHAHSGKDYDKGTGVIEFNINPRLKKVNRAMILQGELVIPPGSSLSELGVGEHIYNIVSTLKTSTGGTFTTAFTIDRATGNLGANYVDETSEGDIGFVMEMHGACAPTPPNKF